MDKSQILSKVQEIFRDVMDNETVVLTDNTSALDVEEWDSMSYLRLIFAIEKNFKIKFNTAEFTSWKNIGEMVNAITSKIK